MKRYPKPRKKNYVGDSLLLHSHLDHLEPFDHNDWHLYPIVTLPAAKQLRDAEDLP